MTDAEKDIYRQALEAAFRKGYRRGIKKGLVRGEQEGQRSIVTAIQAVSPFITPLSVYEKAFNEDDHPRGDNGRFIPKKDIAAAAHDEAKADKLREKVTDPEQLKKLNAAIDEHKKNMPMPTPKKPTVDRTHSVLNRMANKPKLSESDVQEVLNAVQAHTHAELNDIKKRLGIKASGSKAEQAKKIAERLTDRGKEDSRKFSHDKVSMDKARSMLEGLKGGSMGDAAKVASMLGKGLTTAELHALRKEFGIKASGTKSELAWKTAQRYLSGQKQPEPVAPEESPVEPEATQQAEVAQATPQAAGQTQQAEDSVRGMQSLRQTAQTAMARLRSQVAKGGSPSFGGYTPDVYKRILDGKATPKDIANAFGGTHVDEDTLNDRLHRFFPLSARDEANLSQWVRGMQHKTDDSQFGAKLYDTLEVAKQLGIYNEANANQPAVDRPAQQAHVEPQTRPTPSPTASHAVNDGPKRRGVDEITNAVKGLPKNATLQDVKNATSGVDYENAEKVAANLGIPYDPEADDDTTIHNKILKKVQAGGFSGSHFEFGPEDEAKRPISPYHMHEIEHAKVTDKKFGGDGRYESEVWHRLRNENPKATLPPLSRGAAEWIRDNSETRNQPVPPEVFEQHPDLRRKPKPVPSAPQPTPELATPQASEQTPVEATELEKHLDAEYARRKQEALDAIEEANGGAPKSRANRMRDAQRKLATAEWINRHSDQKDPAIIQRMTDEFNRKQASNSAPQPTAAPSPQSTPSAPVAPVVEQAAAPVEPAAPLTATTQEDKPALPKLNAVSDKQRAYAEAKRAKELNPSAMRYNFDKRMAELVQDVAKDKTDAKFWLDDKSPVDTLFNEKYGHLFADKKAADRAMGIISEQLYRQDAIENNPSRIERAKANGTYDTVRDHEARSLIRHAGSEENAQKLAEMFGLKLAPDMDIDGGPLVSDEPATPSAPTPAEAPKPATPAPASDLESKLKTHVADYLKQQSGKPASTSERNPVAGNAPISDAVRDQRDNAERSGRVASGTADAADVVSQLGGPNATKSQLATRLAKFGVPEKDAMAWIESLPSTGNAKTGTKQKTYDTLDVAKRLGLYSEPQAEQAPKPSESDKPKVEYVRAASGGQTSEVDGKFYAGGRLMPVHGKYSGLAKPPKGEGVGTNTPTVANPDSKAEVGGGSSQNARQSMSPEDAKRKAEDQKKWAEMNAGPLGKMMWLGNSPNAKAAENSQTKLKEWREYAEKIGPNGVQKIIDQLEPEVHAAADKNAPDKEGAEWFKQNLKTNATDSLKHLPGGDDHEKKVPNSHYARQLVHEMLDKQSFSDTSGVDRLHKVNSVLSQADAHPPVPEAPKPAEQVPPRRTLAYEGQNRPEYDQHAQELALTESHADSPDHWDALANAGKRDWLLNAAKKRGLGDAAKKLPAKKIVELLRSQGDSQPTPEAPVQQATPTAPEQQTTQQSGGRVAFKVTASSKDFKHAVALAKKRGAKYDPDTSTWSMDHESAEKLRMFPEYFSEEKPTKPR